MSDKAPIAHWRVDELLARIGSHEVSPGAGAAGAIALALAAACASKAVSVSLRHRPEDRELQSALDAFSRVAAAALGEADRDSEAFGALIHDKDIAAVSQLISEAERIEQLIDALVIAIDEVADSIQSNMIGDIVAARTLVTAARRIQERNGAEALQLRGAGLRL
jgi:formiminotetrahydrofolate cyclodeaminase